LVKRRIKDRDVRDVGQQAPRGRKTAEVVGVVKRGKDDALLDHCLHFGVTRTDEANFSPP